MSSRRVLEITGVATAAVRVHQADNEASALHRCREVESVVYQGMKEDGHQSPRLWLSEARRLYSCAVDADSGSVDQITHPKSQA